MAADRTSFTKSAPGQAPSSPDGWRPASETETAGGSSSAASLSDRQRDVLDLLRARGPMSATQAKIELVGRNPGRGGVMSTTLRSLERRGLVSYRDGLWSAS